MGDRGKKNLTDSCGGNFRRWREREREREINKEKGSERNMKETALINSPAWENSTMNFIG